MNPELDLDSNGEHDLQAFHFPPDHGSAPIDYALFPRELPDGRIVFDDAKFGLVDEEFVLGADDFIRKHAKSLPCRMNISSLKASVWCPHTLKFHEVRDGWSFYHDEDGAEIGLCPNFKHYYPETTHELYVGFMRLPGLRTMGKAGGSDLLGQ